MLNLNTPDTPNEKQPALKIAGQLLFYLSLFIIGIFGYYAARWFYASPLVQPLSSALNHLLALQDTKTTWYITRAAGWISYLLVWLSVVWGLVLPTKLFARYLSPTFAFDFHEYLSLLSIGFLFLHIGVLMIDKYLPYNLAQILVPFLSPYRPLWVGIGVLAFYLSLLVTITFYMRGQIGVKTFKAIHLASFLAYIGATIHGFFSGTDSSLGAALLIYLGTFLSVVFLTTYWITMNLLTKDRKQAVPAR